LGLSQEQLAQAMGLSTQSVKDIEGCRMWVSHKTIVKLARALEVEVYQLLLPVHDSRAGEAPRSPLEILLTLQQDIKNEIDRQFYHLLTTCPRGILGLNGRTKNEEPRSEG
jgi:transcriptional regulator with XRE-family HTH domain